MSLVIFQKYIIYKCNFISEKTIPFNILVPFAGFARCSWTPFFTFYFITVFVLVIPGKWKCEKNILPYFSVASFFFFLEIYSNLHNLYQKITTDEPENTWSSAQETQCLVLLQDQLCKLILGLDRKLVSIYSYTKLVLVFHG